MAISLPTSPTPPQFRSWQPAIPHRYAIPRYEVVLPWQPRAVPSMHSHCVFSADANRSDDDTGNSANTTIGVTLASSIAPSTSNVDEDFSVTERNTDYLAPEVELMPPPVRPQDQADALEIANSHPIDDAPEVELAEPESTDGEIATADEQTHVTGDLGTSHTEPEPLSDENSVNNDSFDTNASSSPDIHDIHSGDMNSSDPTITDNITTHDTDRAVNDNSDADDGDLTGSDLTGENEVEDNELPTEAVAEMTASEACVPEDAEGSQPAIDPVTADSTSDNQEVDDNNTAASPEAISETAPAAEYEVAPEPEVAATEVTEAETESLDDSEPDICDTPAPEEEIGIAQQTQENEYAEPGNINAARSESASSDPHSPEASSEDPSEHRAERGTDANSDSTQDTDPQNNSDTEAVRRSTVTSDSAGSDEEAKTIAQFSTIVMTIAIIVFWLLLR